MVLAFLGLNRWNKLWYLSLRQLVTVVQAQTPVTAELDYLGLNPCFTPYCCVALGKLLNLSVPHFLTYNEDNQNTYP